MRLVGSVVTRIKRLEDFTADKAKDEARQGWLTNKKYLAILLNDNLYTDGLFMNAMGQNVHNILNGLEEPLRLCWPNEADPIQYTITESQNIEFGSGEFFMRFDRSYTPTLEKREYIILAAHDMKLVHYGRNDDEARQDKANAKIKAMQLRDGIAAHEATTSGQQDQILHHFHS